MAERRVERRVFLAFPLQRLDGDKRLPLVSFPLVEPVLPFIVSLHRLFRHASDRLFMQRIQHQFGEFAF
ncbi:hypothetical protein D3C75_1347130 [compost metagenome]